MVELAKIDEGVHYVSSDLKQLAPLTDIESLDVNTVVIPPSVVGANPTLPQFDNLPPPPPIIDPGDNLDPAAPVLNFAPELVASAVAAAGGKSTTNTTTIGSNVATTVAASTPGASSTPTRFSNRTTTYSENND